MGYFDTQLAKSQKAISDAVAGKGLQAAIKSLQDASKVKSSLAALPARGAITAKRTLAKATGTTAANERKEVSRTYYSTNRYVRSEDGLFVLVYQNVKTIVFKTGTDEYLDYNPG